MCIRDRSEEDYVKIFERFYQVENIGQYGGTGIGLALSQGIRKTSGISRKTKSVTTSKIFSVL